MKIYISAVLSAAIAVAISGCIAYSRYTNIQPISPKPNSMRIYAPKSVNSLNPEFKWKAASDQKVDLAIWEAHKPPWGGPVTQYSIKGQMIYYREGIVGGSHQIQSNLNPDSVYFWSIKPTGTMNWTTANHVVGGLLTEMASGIFFLIKTP